jgi:hypothetical protein
MYTSHMLRNEVSEIYVSRKSDLLHVLCFSEIQQTQSNMSLRCNKQEVILEVYNYF